ncbi:hypothetical protein NQ318_014005 [Aromia moschata]|uniref:F-box domain-containing protein n=1 Tax=Aromia moschata TaxID=1265417 RepID=A0AAV8Z0E3_9CUCU|nr:hypothetical protein NQ318_014005 [Aromia moschata]
MESNEEGDDFVPIEKFLKMDHLEQYVYRVLDYTSRYNNSNSYYYAPINLVGKYAKYPSYGDFPEAYFLRSYGNWWKKSEGYQLDYRPQDFDPSGAEDYITLEFESAVVPRDIFIYEIYNPGSVVRIWGKSLCAPKCSWVLLWEGPPQIYPHKSRIFHPQMRKVNCLLNTIRLEFNQSHLQYHCSIDAVLLAGYQPSTNLQYNMMVKGLVDSFQKKPEVRKIMSDHIFDADSGGRDLFLNLPYEVIIHIFQYLDLKSLSRCAQVNKMWNEASVDPVLYQNLSLKPYWYLVNCNTLEYFMNKSKTLKKLDLSWCGNDSIEFKEFVAVFLRKDLRLKYINQWFQPSMSNLNKLVSLDLTSTDIQDNDLMTILKANKNLKHIIIDLCENLVRLDQIVEVVEKYNKNLTTWSSWKTSSLTAEGAKHFANCPHLKELDLGWCLINTDPGNCLERIASGCRQLKRLILSEWRGLNDYLLMPVIMACKELTQLDLLGIKNISSDLCEMALLMLPKLRLLDISFCEFVRQEEVEIWRQRYPHITIQRSCQYVVNDYLN